MIDREKVFDALRNCITEPKCQNCPWEDCEKIGHKRVTVPVTLLLDALNLLKEQAAIVRCKDCAKRRTDKCALRQTGDQYLDLDPDDEWYCADGEAKRDECG